MPPVFWLSLASRCAASLATAATCGSVNGGNAAANDAAHGIPVHDKHGDLLPDVDDAIAHAVSAAIWFRPHHRIPVPDRQLPHPRKFLP